VNASKKCQRTISPEGKPYRMVAGGTGALVDLRKAGEGDEAAMLDPKPPPPMRGRCIADIGHAGIRAFALEKCLGRRHAPSGFGQLPATRRPVPDYRRGIIRVDAGLCWQIARQVFGIEVADNALAAFKDGELAYLARRFDVQPNGKRSHQEDFAQIAARSEETHGKNYKYDCSYEEIGDLIRTHVSTYKVDLERFFKLVVFNYLVNNGDAHTKNFSLIRNEQTGEYNLSPAYDLLNTRLHVPDESRTALELFKDEFETESYKINAYYAYDDFVVFAQKLGLVEKRYKRILESVVTEQEAVYWLIECSMLPEECKQLYREHVEDRVRACSYSFSGWRE
jgi:hypothetical protein